LIICKAVSFFCPPFFRESFPLIYDELRRLADHYLRRERPGHTLQPTALVNEAYLQLIGHGNLDWQNRAHFSASRRN
jgi:hypothetical protein